VTGIGEGSANGSEASSESQTVGMRKRKWVGTCQCEKDGSGTTTVRTSRTTSQQRIVLTTFSQAITNSLCISTNESMLSSAEFSQSTQAPEAVRLSVIRIRSIFLSPPPTEYRLMQRHLENTPHVFTVLTSVHNYCSTSAVSRQV